MSSCINHLCLEEADLSVRAFNSLKRAGFDTIGDVTQKNDKELLGIRNLGVGTLAEIKRKLSDEGKILEGMKIRKLAAKNRDNSKSDESVYTEDENRRYKALLADTGGKLWRHFS